MRKGQNPNRQAIVDGYAPIVLSVITHLPNMDGYHEGRLDVIKASLESMRNNAGMDGFQIMVWDNGSCDKLLYWLRRSYQPDYLIQSPNMGKPSARTSILRMLPDKTIVNCADDDMFYYPDWLKAHLEVMTVYPNVGTVSGWPVRTQFRFHNHSTKAWGQKMAILEQGRFISPQEDRDFCASIGRDYDYQVKTSLTDMDYRMNYRGVMTYATGHHCQFVGKAGVLAKLDGYSNEAMRSERPFEQAVDQAGLLRLTTYKRYTRHIGNVLDPELEELWRKLR